MSTSHDDTHAAVQAIYVTLLARLKNYKAGHKNISRVPQPWRKFKELCESGQADLEKLNLHNLQRYCGAMEVIPWEEVWGTSPWKNAIWWYVWAKLLADLPRKNAIWWYTWAKLLAEM